jgi:hypothetical protein
MVLWSYAFLHYANSSTHYRNTLVQVAVVIAPHELTCSGLLRHMPLTSTNLKRGSCPCAALSSSWSATRLTVAVLPVPGVPLMNSTLGAVLRSPLLQKVAISSCLFTAQLCNVSTVMLVYTVVVDSRLILAAANTGELVRSRMYAHY